MTRTWWQESAVYQIYPRSFADSNGDGIGDLRGIISRLDYLHALGVNVVWLSPVYKSPNDDNGYDISDYRNIMPEFGTLADWQEMLEGMHARGIKLVMDLVVNHTSDEHPWFRESKKSKSNPYRDFYLWRPPRDGREPNNWASVFGGSAWQFDAATGEYYLHLFSKKQPDLNWENPSVRQEVFAMMRWWLDRGVDGFRMDVINMISKVPGLPDAPVVNDDRSQSGSAYFINGPRLLEFLGEMKAQVLSKYDILSVGETPSVTTADAVKITNPDMGALNMVFQFEHMDLISERRDESLRGEARTWTLSELIEIMTRWQKDLEGRGWNSIYLSNHDQPRAVSRLGDDVRLRVESAKLLATFAHTLQGTPFIYQGEEIGMTNAPFESIDDYRDIETLNLYRELVEEKGIAVETVMSFLKRKSRDNARTPMQWDSTPQAGFTNGTPWLKVNPNYKEINVAHALADPNSIFHYYRKLIQLRKQYPILVYGTYDLIPDTDTAVYAYTRTLDREQLLVILNFSHNTPVFRFPVAMPVSGAELLISNYPVEPTRDTEQITLRPFEARVYLYR